MTHYEFSTVKTLSRWEVGFARVGGCLGYSCVVRSLFSPCSCFLNLLILGAKFAGQTGHNKKCDAAHILRLRKSSQNPTCVSLNPVPYLSPAPIILSTASIKSKRLVTPDELSYPRSGKAGRGRTLTIDMCQPDGCDADQFGGLLSNTGAEKQYGKGFGVSNFVKSCSCDGV